MSHGIHHHSCDDLYHKKIKTMDAETQTTSPPPPNANYNSYQNLIEGKLEVVVSNNEKTNYLNVSELLRDLYQKHYELRADYNKLLQSATPQSASN
jgi:hypothetical protein